MGANLQPPEGRFIPITFILDKYFYNESVVYPFPVCEVGW